MNSSCKQPEHKDIVNPPRYTPGHKKPVIFNATDYFGNFQKTNPSVDMADGYEEYWQWPVDFSCGGRYLIKLKPGLILVITDHYAIRKVAIDTVGKTERGFVISFALTSPAGGSFSVKVDELVKPVVFAPSQAYITYTPDYGGLVHMPDNTRLHCVGIAMKPWLVAEYLQGCGKKIPDQLNKVLTSPGLKHHYNQQLTVTPLMNLRLHEILGCRYQGSAKRYFFESKVLEIIILAFEQLQCNECTHLSPLCPEGLANNSDFVLKARDILLNNMIAPPSLAELARQVGTNKTTLNQYFRKIYGVSIFEYLRICRLEKSRHLLQRGKKTVTEVALEVGYSRQSSFSSEFTKYFGQSPRYFLQ